MQKPEFTELMRRLGALGDGRHDQSNFTPNLAEWLRRWFCPALTLENAGTLSQDEWEVSYLYLAFVLRKVS
jgi:mRNA (guanine-N7-)-methyltransferase